MSDAFEAQHGIIPISLADGRVARLQLPRDLTEAEAAKIARVVLAYAPSSEAPPPPSASRSEPKTGQPGIDSFPQPGMGER